MDNENLISSQSDARNNDETTEAKSQLNDASSQTVDSTNEETAEEAFVDPQFYESLSKVALLGELRNLKTENDFKRLSTVLKIIEPLYNAYRKEERKVAHENYLAEGGEKDGFDFRGDEHDREFDNLFKELRLRKNTHFESLEKEKQSNLKVKNELLEKLRSLVDGEETTASLDEIREIQDKWKASGHVPVQFAQTLWSNYKALLQRYYDNRSIYFELKELDRKRNLSLKKGLCDRAESLTELDNVSEAILKLNKLHEEYKELGPVPREEQEILWKRFKDASDKIYEKRREKQEEMKVVLTKNLEEKLLLVEEVKPFTEFDSDRINDWNAKTEELMSVQKKWEAIGGMPREKSKIVNKEFWQYFKVFFNNKAAFFKKLEGLRKENLALKEALVKKAEELQGNDDFVATAEKYKALQREWKDVGPVPEKQRNDVFKRFKDACDAFFDAKRGHMKEVEDSYEENLQAKLALCDGLLEKSKEEANTIDAVNEFQSAFDALGFVPRKAIKLIHRKYAEAMEAFLNSVDLSEDEKQKYILKASLTKLKADPNGESILKKKEFDLKKQISKIESEINTLRTNIEFFSISSKASKFKEEFEAKIDKLDQKAKKLKNEMAVMRQLKNS